MHAPVVSSEKSPATPPSRGTGEPKYLEKLWNLTRNESVSRSLRRTHEADYFIQHTKWKTIQARLATAVSTLSASEFWESLCAALHEHWDCKCSGALAKIDEVVCLCLGHLEDHASIYQLSLLILLLGRLGIHHEKCFIYDPCHSTQDHDILNHLGFTTWQENTEARIHVRRMTLFYMPHGDYQLTSNLIETNWCSLNRVAILGNSLAWVCNPEVEHIATSQRVDVTSRAPYVEKVLPLAKETSLPDTLFDGVRQHLRTLLPGAAISFGNGPADALDCTLTTFPSFRGSAL